MEEQGYGNGNLDEMSGMDTTMFEPLGSNCEFGFVLQRNGNDVPALLRWTAINIADLCALLEADFANAFAEENVVPHTDTMVMEKTYNWAFHSALTSDGQGNFTLPPARLKKLFKIEQARLHKAVDDLRERLRGGNVIGVHAADNVTTDDAQRLLAAMDGIAGNATNRLLVVGGTGESGNACGVPSEISPRIFRGYVTRLAPYSQADDADYDSWKTILAGVLEAGPTQ